VANLAHYLSSLIYAARAHSLTQKKGWGGGTPLALSASKVATATGWANGETKTPPQGRGFYRETQRLL